MCFLIGHRFLSIDSSPCGQVEWLGGARVAPLGHGGQFQLPRGWVRVQGSEGPRVRAERRMFCGQYVEEIGKEQLSVE